MTTTASAKAREMTKQAANILKWWHHPEVKARGNDFNIASEKH
jgi:hypothetical protein